MRSRNLLMCLLVAVLSVVSYEKAEAETSGTTFYFYKDGNSSQGKENYYVNPIANYVATGSTLHNECDVPVMVKPGYLFEGWYDWNGNYMVYDANGKAFIDASWARWEKKNNQIVWRGATDLIRLVPRFTKIESNAKVNSVEVVYENGMIVNGESVTCDEADKRYVGVTVGSRGLKALSNTFQGKCYITIDCVNYLGDEQVPYTDNVKTTTRANAPLWTITKVDGGWTIQSENGNYLAFNPGTSALKIAASADEADKKIIWQISRAGFISGEEGFKHNLCYTGKWETNTQEIQAQDRIVKIWAPDENNNGAVTSAEIISAIKEELSKEEYRYTVNAEATDANVCKGLLYVDMSGLSAIEESNAGDWSAFQNEAEANCLFYMPSNFDNSNAFTKNAVVGNENDGFNAVANFVITEKKENSYYYNPLYVPYSFETGSYMAKYTRSVSSIISSQSSLIIPFSVSLADGISNKGVKFSNLGLVSEVKDVAGQNYKNLAVYPITETQTLPNTSYHVSLESSANTNNVCTFVIEEQGVKVFDTQAKEYLTDMPVNSGNAVDNWEAYGNYFGKRVSVDSKYFYYNKGHLWNSTFLYLQHKSSFIASQYRAYFAPKDESYLSGKYFTLFDMDGEEISTGINAATTTTEAYSQIYTISGVKVNGTPKQHGLYIVNGKKVML